MKKKKILSIATAIILFFYLVSLLIVYFMAEKKVYDDFEHYVSSFVSLNVFDDDIYGSIDEFLASTALSTRDYPFIITVCDSDTLEPIAKSGSVIILDSSKFDTEKYCFIDDYLNDDTSKQIADVLSDKNDYYISQFNYNEIDGKIVPISFIFKNNYYKGDEPEIVLSDEKAENTALYDDLEDNSNSLIIDCFVDVDKDSYRHKCYEYMRNNLERQVSGLKYGADGYRYFGEVYYFSYVNLTNGETYYVHVQSKINAFDETIHSYEFISVTSILTIIYFVFTAIILIVLNKYYSKMQKLEKAKYTFTNAAAHELKTPLAVIENQCECILENVNPEKNGEYINSIYEESIRMSQLLSSLLQYNKFSLSDSVEKSKNSLTEIVSLEIGKYKTFAESKHLNIKSSIECGADINCNKKLISLAVDNFISNAVKYSDPDTDIEINLMKEGSGYRFSVFNVCGGIKTDNIWDVLYQSDESRTGASAGIGLAITKQIFELHKYKYGYINRDNGVEFYFTAR